MAETRKIAGATLPDVDSVKFEAGKPADEKPKDEPKDGEGEKPAEKSDPVDALLEKIASLKLTREQHDKLEAGISKIFGGAGSEPAAPEKAETIDKPGDVGMKSNPEIVALAAEVETLKASDRVRVAREAVGVAADAAMARLKGKSLPSDQREQFVAFGTKHGADAIVTLSDNLARSLPDAVTTFDSAIGNVGQSVPDEVLKFQSKGPEVYERAIKFSRMYDTLKASAYGTRLTREQFLATKIGDTADAFERGPTE